MGRGFTAGGGSLGEAKFSAPKRGANWFNVLASARLGPAVPPSKPDSLHAFDPGGSDRELELLSWFEQAGLPRPVQQLWVVAGGKRYCLDYAWAPAKMGLEYDGWDDHGQRLAFGYDRERRTELELAGWLILQVTSRHSRRKVVDWARRGLEQRLPPQLRALLQSYGAPTHESRAG